MGLFKSSQKNNKGAEPPLKKVNIAELLENSNGNKELKEVEIPVAKDLPSISQGSSEEEYLAGSSATYTQISDKEGLDETKELFRRLIYDGINSAENENLNSTLIFGIAGSGKTNGKLELYKDGAICETDL
jgi:hypothetical protein